MQEPEELRQKIRLPDGRLYVVEKERTFFPYQEQADVMFNSALVYELACLKVYAEPLLFGIDKSEPEYLEAKRLLKFLDYFISVPSEDIPHNSLLRNSSAEVVLMYRNLDDFFLYLKIYSC